MPSVNMICVEDTRTHTESQLFCGLHSLALLSPSSLVSLHHIYLCHSGEMPNVCHYLHIIYLSPSTPQHVCLCWINTWSPLCLCINGWLICFLREPQPLSVCVQSVIRVSDDTLTFLRKNLKSICLCVSVIYVSLQKRLGRALYLTHAAPRLTLPSCFSLPLSLQNPPGGKAFRVFAVIWVPQRAASPNRKCTWVGE